MKKNRRLSRSVLSLALGLIMIFGAFPVIALPTVAADSGDLPGDAYVGDWDDAVYFCSNFRTTKTGYDLEDIPWICVGHSNRRVLMKSNGFVKGHEAKEFLSGPVLGKTWTGSDVLRSSRLSESGDKKNWAPDYVFKVDRTEVLNNSRKWSGVSNDWFSNACLYVQKKSKSSGNCYLYLKYNGAKWWLGINRSGGTLILSTDSDDRTEWQYEYYTGQSSYIFRDNKQEKYYLSLTKDGLVLQTSVKSDCYIEFYAGEEPIWSLGYARFIDDVKGTDKICVTSGEHSSSKKDYVTFPSPSDTADGRKFTVWWGNSDKILPTKEDYHTPEEVWVDGAGTSQNYVADIPDDEGVTKVAGYATGGKKYALGDHVNRLNETMYTTKKFNAKQWFASYTSPVTWEMYLDGKKLSASEANELCEAKVCSRSEKKSMPAGAKTQATLGAWAYIALPTANRAGTGLAYAISEVSCNGCTYEITDENRVLHIKKVTGSSVTVTVKVTSSKAPVVADTKYIGVTKNTVTVYAQPSATAYMGEKVYLNVVDYDPATYDPDEYVLPVYDDTTESHWEKRPDPDTCTYTYTYTYYYRTDRETTWTMVVSNSSSAVYQVTLPTGRSLAYVEYICMVGKTRPNGMSDRFITKGSPVKVNLVCAHTDANHDGECDVCGRTGMSVTHTYASAWTNYSGFHAHKCTACDAHDTLILCTDANHDGKCDTCGGKVTVRHTYASAWTDYGGFHAHKCTVCDAHDTLILCTDANHDGKCDTCGGKVAVRHVAVSAWSSDETQHWHACKAASDGCVAKLNPGQHVDADKDGTCDVCGRTGLTVIPDYGTPTYVWSGNTCVATRTDKVNASIKETETVTGTYVKDTDATCIANETGHYAATFTNPAFATQSTAKNSVEKPDSNVAHSFATAWSTNATQHWHVCQTPGCTEKSGLGDHADADRDGKCDICARTGLTVVPDFGAPTYAWDGNECTATRADKVNASIKETETVTGTYVKDTGATCDANEKGHYKATFTNPAFTAQTTAKNSVEKAGTKLTHDYGGAWVSDGDSHWKVCQNAGCAAISALSPHGDPDHDGFCDVCAREGVWFEHEFVTDVWLSDSAQHWHRCAATGCTAKSDVGAHVDADKDGICDTCGYEGMNVVADYGDPTYTWNGNECTATRADKVNASIKETETVTGTYVKDTDATCVANETGHYAATFTNPAFAEQNTENGSVEKPDSRVAHSFADAWTSNATQHWHVCQTPGCTEKSGLANHTDADKNGECDVCGKTGLDVVPDFGTPTYTWNGNRCVAVRTDRINTSITETETVTGTFVKDTDATCVSNETGHYKAVFTNPAFSEQNTAKDSAEKPDTRTDAHVFSAEWTSSGAQHWHVCTVKGCPGTDEPADHVDENGDGICDTCGYDGMEVPTVPEIVGASVRLGTDLCVEFYVTLPDDRKDTTLTVTADHNGTAVTETLTGQYADDKGLYVFRFTGVTPQSLGDLMTATLIYGGNTSDTLTGYSVASELETLLAATPDQLGQTQAQNDAMRQLIYDLVAYGNAAQIYRNYKTSDLVGDRAAFAGMTPRTYVAPVDPQKSIAQSASPASSRFLSAYVGFDSTVSLGVRFTVGGGVDTETVLRIKSDNGDAAQISMLMGTGIENADGIAISRADGTSDYGSGAEYAIELNMLDLANPDLALTLTLIDAPVYDGDEVDLDQSPATAVLTYSLAAYVNDIQSCGSADMASLARALWNYATSAKAYAELTAAHNE